MRNSILVAMAAGLALALVACGTDDPGPANAANAANNAGCVDACELGQRSCLDGTTLQVCRRGIDGCTEQRDVTCLDAEECRDGDCLERPRECEDQCTPPGSRCTADGEVETCSDHDRDGCFEFGGAEGCDTGDVCDEGLCVSVMCSDRCAVNDTACTPEGDITSCGPTPAGCLDFINPKECPNGTQCVDGACVMGGGCEDECEMDETICTAGGEVRTCGDFDGDACLDLSQAAACPGGQTCRGDGCVSATSCQDRCLAGEAVCIGNDITSCTTQGDGCLAFDPPSACPGAGESCISDASGTRCEAGATTGAVVINEVFYNPVGDDYRNGASPTFVELAGPPGLPIDGFRLELINGSTGAPYGSATFPTGARLDGNGYAVMAMADADNFLKFAAPGNIYYELAPYASGSDAMQNGPDALALQDASGTLVDAVAYGSYAPNDPNFTGEVAPVPAPVPGRSIGRRPGAADTNHNANDFTSFYPTPGLENADLIINEIYFDQPGADGPVGQTETFVELIAPILGWEDMPLDGYVLRAINGFNDMDYIFSGSMNQTNGIEMTAVSLDDHSSIGVVVVCNLDLASASLLDECIVPYEGVDFQNGPDYFVLEYDGDVIDAVAYGSFATSPAFGEGMPASWSGSIAGKALARWPISDPSRSNDTGNNSADFFVVSPSPGSDNPLPTP